MDLGWHPNDNKLNEQRINWDRTQDGVVIPSTNN